MICDEEIAAFLSTHGMPGFSAKDAAGLAPVPRAAVAALVEEERMRDRLRREADVATMRFVSCDAASQVYRGTP